jgi:CRISPR-associated RAMP protein (TIGR02581 family)
MSNNALYPSPALDSFHSRLTLTGRLVLNSALRVGAQKSVDAVDVDLPVIKDVLGRPYIPGSSFKGALRSQVEALMRTIQTQKGRHDLSCESVSKPLNEESYPGCLTNAMFKTMKKVLRDDPERLDRQLRDRSCWTCRVFGASWLASKVLLKDLPVDEDAWFGRYEVRDGVGIDRDTGRAAKNIKYQYEVVPAGTAFHFKAVVENASDAELGLFMLGLKQFEEGVVQLGGARSRGLGWCTLQVNWDTDCTLVRSDQVLMVLLGQDPETFGAEDRDNCIQTFAAMLQEEEPHAQATT